MSSRHKASFMRHCHVGDLLSKLSPSIGAESAKLELKWMIRELRNQLTTKNKIPLPDLTTMVERRAKGEPLQYILGSVPFGPLNLRIRPPTLIPRPETEEWTTRLAEEVSPNPKRPIKVLDLCTGSGCIPLLLSHIWQPGSSHSYGVDISEEALLLATENSAICGVPAVSYPSTTCNTYNTILGNVLQPSFQASLPVPFDLVTSNPPYIPHKEYERLPRSVKDYEDARALLADPPECDLQDGLTFYRAIARFLFRDGVLGKRGVVALEVGDGQAEAVSDIMSREARGFDCELWTDFAGKQRTIILRNY